MSHEPSRLSHAVFAGGCFWCTEAVFQQILGVTSVVSGYAGGSPQSATYQQVCSGMTGHAEVIRVEFDPTEVSFDQLLDIFFDSHDPTQLNRQGADVGTQYRSAIFYADEFQKTTAAQKIQQLNEARKFPRPIVTTLEPLETFFPAEQYHQDYARQHPDQPYIVFQTLPKVCKVREHYPDRVRPVE